MWRLEVWDQYTNIVKFWWGLYSWFKNGHSIAICSHGLFSVHALVGRRVWWGVGKTERERKRIFSFLKVHQFYWIRTPPLWPQFSSVAQSCLTLCDPMNRSMPGLPVQHQLPEFTQTHVHGVGDAIQPSHRLSSPFPPAPNPSQHQSLFQWVNSLHEVAKVLEFQL